MQAQTHDSQSLRILRLVDENSRACLGLKVARRVNNVGVIGTLANALCLHGIPKHIRCDNDPEMILEASRRCATITNSQIQTIAPEPP